MSTLFTPIQLGKITLPNRIVVAPMCQYSAVDGTMTDWHLVHLGSMAVSGAGLTMVEATGVTREGRISHGCTGLYSDNNEAAMKRVVDACRIPYLAVSLGGVESLIEQPAIMSFYELTTEERLEIGIKDNLIRYSVGIEDADDLIADLAQALDRAFAPA